MQLQALVNKTLKIKIQVKETIGNGKIHFIIE